MVPVCGRGPGKCCFHAMSDVEAARICCLLVWHEDYVDYVLIVVDVENRGMILSEGNDGVLGVLYYLLKSIESHFDCLSGCRVDS